MPPEYWEDRLLRLKAMGLNSIQTYGASAAFRLAHPPPIRLSLAAQAIYRLEMTVITSN